MKRAYKGFLLITAIILLAGCQKQNSDQVGYQQEIENVQFFGKDETKEALCMVTDADHIGYAYKVIPNRYLALTKVECTIERFGNVVDGSIYNYNYDSYQIDLYSVETKELVKTYSLEQLEAALPEGYRIYWDYLTKPSRKEGQDYLVFGVVKYEEEPTKDYELKCLTVNIDTDEIQFWEEEDFYYSFFKKNDQGKAFEDQLAVFWEWTDEEEWYQFYQANGFLPLLSDKKETVEDPLEKRVICINGSYLSGYRNEGIAEIQMRTEFLPENNIELYRRFPGLKEYQGQEGLFATIFLGGFPSSEEIFRLVIEDGQEISFEGCVMDGKYSKDGQIHEISSFAEFEEWYQDPQK